MDMELVQAGELIVTGFGTVTIPLRGLDTRHTLVSAEFDDSFISSPCDPQGYDSLEYNFDDMKGLTFTWNVSSVRVIQWRIDY